MLGGDAGGGLLAQAYVAAEAGQVLVSALGLQLGGGAAGLCEMLQRRMSELVQRPALAVWVESGSGGFEQVFGTRVGQAAPPFSTASPAVTFGIQ
ncbi:hypothetical protein [Nonomuraea sp. NPDC003709]|uniref:hypothetical protein n=1 Tax=Nonomuraea sp. NPDC003709 TaxID=3154450 RepID=UPI0033BD6223